jgi:hypothetical protein
MRCQPDLLRAGIAIVALGIAACMAAAMLTGCAVPVRVVESNPIPVCAPEKPTSWGPNGEVRSSEPVPLPVTPYGGFSATIAASASEPARTIAGAFSPVAPTAAADLPRTVSEPDASSWLAGLGGLAAALGLPGAGLVGWLFRQKSLLSKALDMAIAYGKDATEADPTDPNGVKAMQDEHRERQRKAGVHDIIKKRL